MDPSDHDKGDLGKGASGGHGPTHANGGPPGGDVWLRSVLESVHEVIFQMDGAGRWTFLNRAWEAGLVNENAAGTWGGLTPYALSRMRQRPEVIEQLRSEVQATVRHGAMEATG